MANSIQFPHGDLPPSYFTEYRGHILVGVGVTFMVLDSIAFFLRVLSRRLNRISMGWDDIIVIPALIFNLALDIILMLMIPYGGVGHHSLVTLREDPSKFIFLSEVSLLVAPILYVFAVNLSKLAIVAMFLRIFTIGWARQVTKCVGVLLIIQAFALFFTIVFQCKPVHLLWTRIDNRDTCLDIKAFFAYASIPNIITDLVLLLTPLPTIWNLKATLQLKIGVTVTLFTASSGILASILRTIGFFTVPIFEDPGWLNVTVFAYTVAEPGTYFLAACFPTYRSLFSYLKSKRLRSTFDATKSFATRSKKYGNITRNLGDSGKGYIKHVDDSRDTSNLVEEESISLAELPKNHTQVTTTHE
ncbi:hypothetical protein EAE96_008296 [Botrytis aclada]|nr:hypothetical protein EAE96_008296 [Botrytis aclada]